ncbi:MAG: hypothetical protein H7288_18070 [Kineosporiaceae bacterium]|nr:hypothetical protein [Aeromicrobium sp.]
MSFDIFLQDFSVDPPYSSQDALGDLDPFLDRDQQKVITGDGSTEVYGLDSHPLTGCDAQSRRRRRCLAGDL